MGDGEWLKEAEKRKTTGRRNVGRNIWKKKNSATIFSARDKQRNLNISKDSNGILNEKFQELGIGKYEKNMDNIFETLMIGGNPKLAIRYAKRIINNGKGKTPAEIAPGTKVFELVEELAKYLPEEVRVEFLD